MSRNRIYQTSVTHRVKPQRWVHEEAAQIAEAQTRVKPSSWWTAFASPESRAAFIIAARQQDAIRERKRYSLTLKVDAQ